MATNKYKRLENSKLEVVPIPANIHFSENVFRRDSLYGARLTEAIGKGHVLKIAANDKYLLQQLRAAAKKLNVRLVFSIQGADIFIKPVESSTDEKRLMVFLREPRSPAELMAKKFELHLQNTLSKLAGDGLAHINKDKWVLTAKGLDQL